MAVEDVQVADKPLIRAGMARATPWPVIGLALGVTVLAAVVGFLNLGNKPLAQDEATSWFIAQLDWAGLWEAVSTSEANGGLYYGLLHLWLNFGDSEVTIRTLSVISGVATIPILYALGARLFGRGPAFIGSVMLAVNAFFVSNVQDARGYSLGALLITISSYLFVRLLWEPTGIGALAYAIVSALAVYAHFFGVLVLAAHVLSLAFVKWGEIPFKRLLPSYGAIAFLISPLVVFALTNDVGQIDWIREPTLTGLTDVLKDLTGQAGAPLLIGYGVALLIGLGAAIWARRQGRASFDSWRFAFLLLWVLVPIAVSFGFSYVKPIFESRYLMVTMPAIALLGAAGLWVIRFRLVPIAVFAIAVVLSVQAVGDWYDTGGVQWAVGVRKIVQNTQPGDGMVFYAPTMLRPYMYYAHRRGVIDDLPELIYPSSYDWPGFSRTRYEPNYAAIGAAANRSGRMWLIRGKAGDEPRRVEARQIANTLRDACPQFVAAVFGGRIALFAGCR